MTTSRQYEYTVLVDPAEVQQAAMIALAYPLGEDFKAAYREPIQKFMYWDAW